MNIIKKYWKISKNDYTISIQEKIHLKINIFLLLENSIAEPKISNLLEKSLQEIFDNENLKECDIWMKNIIISKITTNNELFAVLITLKSMVIC